MDAVARMTAIEQALAIENSMLRDKVKSLEADRRTILSEKLKAVSRLGELSFEISRLKQDNALLHQSIQLQGVCS